MPKSKYEDNSFKKLVQAIDEKWSHTYIDVEYDEPEKSIDEILDEIHLIESK